MNTLKLAIVDDEKILRISLTDDLEDAGYKVYSYENPALALENILNKSIDVVITDIKMPQMNGIELLKKIKAAKPEVYVIVMTAFGSVDAAVESMSYGAYDYISKPFKFEELIFKLRRIQEIESVKIQNQALKEQIESSVNIDKFIGTSEQAKLINSLVDTVAMSSSTVLITGETGTGKELLANVIHKRSALWDRPMIKVSCAILSRDIFESELFGHEKGAFTGAIKDRAGRFELADGGTIYLDDIDDIPLDLQVKLLRVLQEQEFERVGGNETIKVNVRVIASTKADLKMLVEEKKFREDLYYRLNVFPINIPPLRDRRDDIDRLIDFFLIQFSPNKRIQIPQNILDYLHNYTWPGNVRELKNIIERIALIANVREIDKTDLPIDLTQNSTSGPIGEKPLDEILAEYEINLIKKAMKISNGNKSKAAEILMIPPSTLRTKIEKYNLQ